MTEYHPHRWAVLKIEGVEEEPLYKVLGSWYGGHLGSDSWRLNSGIVSVEKEDDEGGTIWSFWGSSGSVYRCHESGYGMSLYTASVEMGFEKMATEEGYSISLMPEDTDWESLYYSPS